jgi:hypothetical protein
VEQCFAAVALGNHPPTDLPKGMPIMKLSIATLLCIVFASIPSVRAEVPNLRKDKLQEFSTHIVVGTVKLIAAEEDKSDRFINKVGVVEIRITKVEKGEKIETGDSIYARFWTQGFIGKGPPPPGSAGHLLPKKGDSVRAYLEKKDGGFDALLPNGFEVIAKPK